MYTITWINPLTKELFTISTPVERTALRVYMNMRRAGENARIWKNSKPVLVTL